MWKKVLGLVLALLLVVSVGVSVYLNDYYRADEAAIAELNGSVAYTLEILDDGTRAYLPADGEYFSAIIFYPGGKVEYTAYEPLLARCAEKGVLCLLVEMPGNLAVLDMDAAQRVKEFYPEVEYWYLAGHSLGGSMAASFAAEADWVDGLILLAAYSTENMTDMGVLSIYGSEDGVLNMEKYAEYQKNLPMPCEIILEGGNHAYFGVYGEQEGDGTATITNLEQIEQTAELMAAFAQFSLFF